MLIKSILIATLLLVSCNSFAQDIGIIVVNPDNKKTFSYLLETESFDIDKKSFSGGFSENIIPSKQSGKYSISRNKLYFGGNELHDASSILFEGGMQGYDLLIIKDYYNSFSNPLRWLFAIAGHPVQGNKVYVLKIVNGKLIEREKILKIEPGSSRLHALVKRFP